MLETARHRWQGEDEQIPWQLHLSCLLYTSREDVEFYTHGGMLTAHQPSRLMLVTDRQMTLTADCGAFANWSGTVSNNGLMVKILSEHIQHDITLLQLQEKYGLEMY